MIDSWTDWQTYQDWHPDQISFKETLDGGQAFCWFIQDDNTYEGVVLNTPLRIRWENPDIISWSSPNEFADQANQILKKYLGSNESYQKYYDTLPWRSDPHLKRCMEQLPFLRILCQPAEETLLGFLCSATKQIVQIKEMLSLLRDQFGTQLPSGHKALPTWEQLEQVPEQALRDCKFGFRAANIKKTADLLKLSPGYLKQIDSLDYQSAKSNLCTLPGVGEKVADCVLLFGYNRLKAFPVDTWISKVMQRHYQLNGWKPDQVGHFGRTHFGQFAGLAQQFLFAWERSQSSKKQKLDKM